MDGQSCANCRFSKAYDVPVPGLGDYEYTHRCRWRPRQQRGDNSFPADRYPAQFADDWCGQWEPANPETVEQGAAVLARLVLLGDLTAARALADKLLGND